MAENLPPETKVPALPSTDDSGFQSALKEIVEVREGRRGNPLDRGVTFRDLVDAGMAAPNPARAAKGRQTGGKLIVPQGGGRSGPGPILTTPPRPSGVVAVGAMTSIMLRWNAPGYGNHAYAEILRADVNDFGQASVIGMSSGTQYPDPVGEGATKWYWVRFVTTSNVRGTASAAVQGKTTLNPEYVMAHLLSQVWSPSTAYSEFQYVRPTVDNGFLYLCSDPGLSGTVEPAWPTTVYDEVTDSGVTWTCVPATERVPFMIGTVNGQPAVVMDATFINDASITVAKIKDAFLDNLTAVHGTLAFARIEKGNIFELTISGSIQSSNYSPGSSFCIAPGEPGYIDGDGWIIRESRGSAAYIAEFYGDTLFSGDLRASRVLGAMLVGAEYGVASDADNCSFEFVGTFGTVSDVVYGERSDPYLTYNVQVSNFPDSSGVAIPGNTTVGMACFTMDASFRLVEHPFAGLKAGVQPLAWPGMGDNFYYYYGLPGIYPAFSIISSLAGWVGQGKYNIASIRTNPLNIISYNAVAPRNYNRYRHRDINCRIAFTRDSSSPLLSARLRFRILKGNSDTVAATIKLGYSIAAMTGVRTFYIELNGVSQSVTSTVIASTTAGTYTWLHVVDNPDMRAELTIKTVLISERIREYILAGSYIELKRMPFDYAVPEGISTIADTQMGGGITAEFPGEVGLNIGFSLSSAMDNTV